MASQLCSIRLVRQDTSIPWGFRLEGGTDFGHSIMIQHVNPGSIADYSGLRAGDHVIRINQSETKFMRHEDAKMEIIRSSNDLELYVQRGEILNSYTHQNNLSSSPMHTLSRSPKPISPQPMNKQTIWQPKVVSSIQMSPNHNQQQHEYGTHVSLEATQNNEDLSIGVKHNISPLPFGQSPPAPGENFLAKVGEGRYRKISHSSYNSPMGLYNQKNRNQTFERTLSSASSTGNQ
nr:SJCHGC09482 protein [Schistosoma japonicum]